ncbi:MAG: amidase family protein, partial [Oscillospiraceae bacterium]
PSALCGVYGLKPTYGTVSRYGLIAFASSLDQIGPMGRCTEDVAMLYDVIKGHDIMEATSIKREYINFAENLKGDVKGLRIGIPKEFFTEGIDAEVRDCVMAEIEKFKNCGAEIVEVSLPSTKYGLSDYYIIACAEASSNLSRFDGVRYGYRTEKFDNILDLYTKTRSEGFGEEVKRRILLGTFVLSAEFYDAHYKRAKLLQNKIQNEFKSVFEKCDVLMTPTSPSVAFKLGEKVDDPLKMYAADALTVTTNIAGVPALSVPCGKNDAGLPIGLQIIGPKFSEEVLFKVSEYYEKNIGTAAKIADVK